MAKWEISLFCSQNRASFKCEPAVQFSEASSCAWEPGKTVFVQLFKIYLYYFFSDKKKATDLFTKDSQSQQYLHLQIINDQTQFNRSSVTQLPASSLVEFNYF